jgi:hypothetical protein
MTASPRILVRKDNQNSGPYSIDQLNTMLIREELHPNQLAWIEGAPQWQLLDSISGIIKTTPGQPAPRPHNRPSSYKGRLRSDQESDCLILPAFLLAIFLGPFGAHRFYCRKTSSAILMLVLTCTVVGAIATIVWSIIDWIMIITESFTDDRDRPLKQWT